jgi:hypothetical protein
MIDIQTAKRIIGSDEDSNRAINLVLENSEFGSIEFEAKGSEEILLILTQFNLAMPIDSISDSLSWRNRILSSSVKRLEIPYIIRLIFSELKRGKSDLRRVVTNYFERIGEKRAEEFYEILKEIFESAENHLICGEEISMISAKYNRDGGVVISELKGAGIISPISGCGSLTERKQNSPVYQINRFIYEILKLD